MSALMEISSREGETMQKTGSTAGPRSMSCSKQMGPGKPVAERSTHRTGGPGTVLGTDTVDAMCGRSINSPCEEILPSFLAMNELRLKEVPCKL